MTLALMQPYIFPYLGYFQLIESVDTFVFYDDVTFIKQGWINRNRILVNGDVFTFTIPVKNISSNTLIKDVMISGHGRWQSKLIATVKMAYRKAPHVESVVELIERVILDDTGTIGGLSAKSVCSVMEYVGLSRKIGFSSKMDYNRNVGAFEKIKSICDVNNATRFVNPIGGSELYDCSLFEDNGLHLYFVKPDLEEYPQYATQFTPGLSIIDVLMHNTPSNVRSMMGRGVIV